MHLRPLIVTAALLATACVEQEFSIDNIPPPPGDLTLTGRVCDPVLQQWLPDALVYTHLYDDDDVVYDTRQAYTDADGVYVLSDLVANKTYDITIQKGHDVIEQYGVELGAEDLTLQPPPCFGEVDLQVAVVTGSYDDLEPTLEAVGVTGARVIDGQSGTEIVDFLASPDNLAEYDIVFFDGGHREDGVIYGTGPVQQVQDTLRAYVQDGGVVFASDWAYDMVEVAWPDRIEFFGDDTVPDAAQVGEPGTVTAAVVDPTLSSAVQAPTVDVSYDLPVWPLIESVAGGVTVYLEGDAPYRQGFDTDVLPASPLLVSFDDGDGRVMLTTYRNSANNSEAMLGVLLALVEGLQDDPTGQ